jgi:hypothetical protein
MIVLSLFWVLICPSSYIQIVFPLETSLGGRDLDWLPRKCKSTSVFKGIN